MQDQPYSLKLFGGVLLTGPSGPISGRVVQRRQLAVLALLSVQPDKGLTREKLVGFIWPEIHEERARRKLSDTLYIIRQALGEHVIQTAGDVLWLNRELVAADVQAFESALESLNLKGAAALYAGPFMEGFHVKGAPEFSRWVDAERRRFADRYAGALEVLAERADAAGLYRESAESWKRLIAHDPLNSRFVLGLMRALAASGDPGNALEYAESHRVQVRDELDVEPSDELLAFAEDLRRRRDLPANGISDAVVREAAPSSPPPASAQAARTQRTAVLSGFRRLGGFGQLSTRKRLAVTLTGLVVIASWVLLSQVGSPAGNVRGPYADTWVVVAPFANLTNQSNVEHLRFSVSSLLSRAIASTGRVRLRATWETLPAGQHDEPKPPSADWLRTFAAEAKAGLVVSGAIYPDRDSLRFDVQITDVGLDEVLAFIESVRVSPANPEPGVQRLADRVASKLLAIADPLLAVSIDAKVYVPSYEALNEHVRGLAAYSRVEYDKALGYFYRAANLDTTFGSPVLFAANTHANIKRAEHEAAFDSIVETLSRTSRRFSPAERHWLDGLLAMRSGFREAALSHWLEALELVDDPLLRFKVGRAAIARNRPQLTLEMFANLDPERGMMRGWHYYWWVLTSAYHLLGRHEEELAAALRGQQQYPKNVYLLKWEARALGALGRAADARAAFERSRALPWDDESPADVIEAAGIELLAHGHRAAGLQALELALDWLTSRPVEEMKIDRRRTQLGRLYYALGRFADAGHTFEELLNDYPRHLNRIDIVGFLGVIAARLGDEDEVERIVVELEQADGNLFQMSKDAIGTYWLACIASVRGELDAAIDLLYEAFHKRYPHHRPLGSVAWEPHTDLSLASLRDHPAFKDLLQPIQPSERSE